MTMAETPERARLAHIVASGLHQLAAVAAQQLIEDRIERGRADESLWNDFNAVAINLKQPYMAALVALAGDDLIMNKTCNETFNASNSTSKVGTDEQDTSDTGLQGANAMHSGIARSGGKPKRKRRQ